MTIPFLSILLLIPLAGALLTLAIPKRLRGLICALGCLFSLATTILSGYLWWSVAVEGGGSMLFVEEQAWIPELEIFYTVGVDGLSAPMLFLTGLLTTLALFYSAFEIQDRVREFFVLFLLLETGMLGVFLALDLVLFYVFWELGLVPMFLLIGVWGGERREYAAIKFFLYTLAGSVFGLLGILAVYYDTGTFNILEAAALRPFADNLTWATLVFWALFVAFGIKVTAEAWGLRHDEDCATVLS